MADDQICELNPAKPHFPRTLQVILYFHSHTKITHIPLDSPLGMDLPAAKELCSFFIRIENKSGKSDALTLGGGDDANQAESPETVARLHGRWVAEVTEPWPGFHK